MMPYIVRVGERDYIGEGANYTIQGESFVPFTSYKHAKRYKTKSAAERASKRSGENMHEAVTLLEVEE